MAAYHAGFDMRRGKCFRLLNAVSVPPTAFMRRLMMMPEGLTFSAVLSVTGIITPLLARR